jgi:hypothetical protein
MIGRPRQRRGLTRIQGSRIGRELHNRRLARDGHGCRLRGGSAGTGTSESKFRRVGERPGRPSTAECDSAIPTAGRGATGRIHRIPCQGRAAAAAHRCWRGSQGDRHTRSRDIDVYRLSCRAAGTDAA